MKILVTGGAGYIGSFMVDALVKRGDAVTVLDNLQRGHREMVNKGAHLIVGDIRDTELLNSVFLEGRFDAILHFAGLISVEESTKNPEIYFENNVDGSRNLFETAVNNNVTNFIFSSTAAVYGNPRMIPIPEDHDKNPTSPYGESKLETEKKLLSLRNSHDSVSFACLRYFNASGGAVNGEMGEMHNPETHIIPLAIKAAVNGQSFKLFGVDYDTPDGTCLRDYIHVLDLVQAHLLALDHITNNKGAYYYNVGTGIGVSNKEIVEMVRKVSGLDLNVLEADRRSGDADRLIADPSRIKNELGFSPKFSDIETIVKTAWQWHSKND
jgi:UDP-glucose 4-epimerase